MRRFVCPNDDITCISVNPWNIHDHFINPSKLSHSPGVRRSDSQESNVEGTKRSISASACRWEIEEKIIIAIVFKKGWAPYSVLRTESAEDLDWSRRAQVYLHFNDIPLHFQRPFQKLLQSSLDDEAIPWTCGGNRFLFGPNDMRLLRVTTTCFSVGGCRPDFL